MAERNFPYWVSFVVLICAIHLSPVQVLLSQPLPDSSKCDTSYFISGSGQWNLLESVIRGDHDCAYLLLNRGADPDAKAEGGKTALTFAAESGDTLMIKLLVLNGAETELSYLEKTTPLMAAVLAGRFDAAHELLKLGADPDCIDSFGGRPLHYAAALNDYQMCDLLLFFGANDTLKDEEGNNALLAALIRDNIETCDVLLQNGLDVDARNTAGLTALMLAAQEGDSSMTAMLLEYEAGIELTDKKNMTALAHAVRREKKVIVQMLVDSGANVNHRLNRRNTLMDLTRSQENNDIRTILERKGAKTDPSPDFSQVEIGWGNSFARGEHMMQARFSLLDAKYGFYLETGVDVRPVLRVVQVEINKYLYHQYREGRISWTHGMGKYFRLARESNGGQFGCYTALYGMLSFPSWQGIEESPKPEYDLVPSLGVFFGGEFAGIKAGAERYRFSTSQERAWKMNITLFLRIK